MEIGQIVLTVVVIVLMLINWVIYHSIFDVTYFGGRGCLTEIVGCFIAAVIEIGLVVALINKIFGTSFLGAV